MSNDQLRETLEELHLELLRTGSEDPALKEKADALAEHIREALEQDDLQDSQGPLNQALGDAVLSFETTYPKVTQLIGNITNLLNSIGL